VVAWPTRGTAAKDAALITKLKAAFLYAHPETTGQVQVLLITDTSTYRIAYVTAKSPTGVLESWFYGPVGSGDLVEGVVQYGGGLDVPRSSRPVSPTRRGTPSLWCSRRLTPARCR
jgi:hypothetical protein